MTCDEFIHLLFTNAELAEKEVINSNKILKKKNSLGETAFHYIVIENKIDLFYMLLRHGVDINTQDKFGATPLMHSIRLDRKEIFNCLLHNDADVDIKTINDDTALSYAIEGDRKYFVNQLLPICHKPIQYYFSDVDAMMILQNPDSESKKTMINMGLKNPYE